MVLNSTDKSTPEYNYSVVKETISSDILGEYTAYGIRVTHNGSELELISDISTDLQKAEQLARYCTDGQLHPIHIPDVIEDFLVDFNE